MIRRTLAFALIMISASAADSKSLLFTMILLLIGIILLIPEIMED